MKMTIMTTFNIIKRINTRDLVITPSFLSSQSLIKRITHEVKTVQQEKSSATT